jgi:hypothetical protein
MGTSIFYIMLCHIFVSFTSTFSVWKMRFYALARNSYLLSRAINFGRQCHFKIWLDCHKFKNFPSLIMSMLTKCQKNEKKKTINVIQRDDRL